MKKNLLILSIWISLCMGFVAQAQITIPGDSIVYGPMFSPVYENSVRVWVLTKNDTGTGENLELSFTNNTTPETEITGTVFNSDTRLGYNLRSYEFTGLTEGDTYTTQLIANGTPVSNRITSITNGQNTLSDFEFLSGGCGRIYDITRCIDQPEAEFHVNGTPTMFNTMAEEGSDLMVWLGDATYLLGLQHAMGQCPDGVDDWANKDMAFDRYRFQRDYHDSLTVAMPQLAITDNHDLGPNEFDKNLPTIGEMREIFMDWWPNPEYLSTPEGQGLHSSYKYKDVEYFLTDNRSYRDNTHQHFGPDQLDWLKQGLLNSTATFKVIVSGTPVFYPIGGRNFSVSTQHDELFNFIQNNNINGVLAFSADIHQQKFLVTDGNTNYPLYDVLSGNINSDVGNGNFNTNYDSNHILQGVKQTYLRVNVYGEENDRRMKVEYVGNNGEAYFEEIIHEGLLTSQNEDAHNLALAFSNSIEDSSEFTHNITGSAYSFTANKDNEANQALAFSGETSLEIDAANSLEFHDKSFSLSYWINPSTLTEATILTNAANGNGVSFGLNESGNITFTNHQEGLTYESQYNIITGNWSYVTWKYDNIRRKLSLYYNGFLIQNWNDMMIDQESLGNITIGENYQGSLDELNLYSRLISEEEIMENADVETSRGEVLKLSGGQQLAIPGSVLNPVLDENFTIEFWAKLNADPGSNSKILSSNGRINGNSTGISFEYPDSKKLNVVVGNNSSGWNTLSEQGEAWNIGEWNHVAVSAIQNGSMKYYVNGDLVAEGSFGEYVPNDWGLGMGHSPYYGSEVNAELDELKVWERALTEEEIKAHMHYAITGSEEDLAIYYSFGETEEEASSVTSLGSVTYEMELDGATLASATSPVSNLAIEYQDVVSGKWSQNNDILNAGLSLPEEISAYNKNVIVGKQIENTLADLAEEELQYLAGGWKIDPINTPFATVKINLAEALGENFETVSNMAGQYFLIKGNTEDGFTSVADGNFDGQNVNFFNTNLEETVYYLAWAEADFVPGRGGAISLTGGHQVHIPSADMEALLAEDITIEFWVNVTQDPGNNDPLLSNHGRINNNTTGFSLEMPDNNSVSAVFGTNTGSWNAINSGESLNIGEWNHIAVTASPNQEIKLYVNGELKNSNAFGTYASNGTWDFALGKSLNYGGQTYAAMDEFRVWSKLKSQEEIVEQMHCKVEGEQEDLVFNFNFDQEDTGVLENEGSYENEITYTSAQIISATSPVSEINPEFPSLITGNWSIMNEDNNGLYLKNVITSYTENVVIGHHTSSEILELADEEDTFYVSGGWHINSLNIETTDLQVDLSKVFDNAEFVNASVAEYLLLKGDPTSNYEVLATGTEENGTVDFNNVDISLGNYYLAFVEDTEAAIALQGGALDLQNGHDVQLPKEGVNTALSGEFTIELWGRLDETAGGNTKLVGFSNFGGGEYGWEMEFLNNQTLQTITGKGPTGGWNSLNSNHVWNIGEWNHAAVTFVPNGEFKFYINGELVDSMNVGEFHPCVNNLAFGKNISNNSPTNSSIDEFRIWTTAKTQEEIKESMYLTIAEETTDLVYNYTFNQENSGYLVNSGSQTVEVQYNNSEIIPATGPIRDVEAPFRNQVTGHWSVMNDNGNGFYIGNEIEDYNSNVVVGKEEGEEVLPSLGSATTDILYLNSRWLIDPLFVENASVKVDLTKVFENLNNVDLIANEYYLLQGDPALEVNVIATGTKEANIVSFPEMEINSNEVYLAWKNIDEYPMGTFPIAQESIWKYNDNGEDLTSEEWTSITYNDEDWAFGNAILGYGDGIESTTLDYGSDSSNKYPTYYLRHRFEVEDLTDIGSLVFKTMKDDGVVVYVNGEEAFRLNMPEGAIDYNTYALEAIGGADEEIWHEVETENLLQVGENVIAVELHQGSAGSSDLRFDMEVDYNLPPIPASAYPLVKESEWNYLDTGISLDEEAWNETGFDYTDWNRGFGTLGYGDPVITEVSYGPDASDKYITTYFVREMEVDLSEMTDMVEFGIRRDDGAVVYVNGEEVFRDNMPEGDIDYQTHSAEIISGSDEINYQIHQVPKSAFQAGVNTIAVEVHNRDGQSSDMRFDLYIKNVEAIDFDCDEPRIGCFTSIVPTAQTPNLIIPSDTHRFQLIFKQGDAYLDGSGNVPGNNDFTAYIPIDGSSENGYLSVNHENTPGGVSIVDLHLNTDNHLWEVDYSQPVDLYNNVLATTTRNCSGGITPWGTVVTAEESTNNGDENGDGYQDVGWLVEIDPETAQVMDYGNGQEKLWAMGRMNHENVVISPDATTAYYGEDGGTHCVYKYVMDTPGDLTSGTVYVLKLDLPLVGDEPTSSTAEWIEVPNDTQAERNNLNTTAATLGGTNFNGVEDCEIHPTTGQIYFTAKGRGRTYRFTDNGTNSVTNFETFLGGMNYDIETAEGTFSEPWGYGNDNLAFDDKGNLWVLQDGGNNYIWVVRPDHTQANPKVELFASMPNGSEPTGLTFSPDFKYGFFSVQHPSGNNEPQQDATFNDVTINASSTVVFSLNENLGIQAPVTDFVADQVQIQQGETVTFTNLSTNNPDTWNWTFEGGDPATSTEENPTVTYTADGLFNVKLETSNVAGNSEMEKSEYIQVETLSVDNALKGKVAVYPNPTSGEVYIEVKDASTENINVEVFDLLGRRVKKLSNTKLVNGKINLNLSESIQAHQMLIIQVDVAGKSGRYKVLTNQ
ncbi:MULTISPECIES: LamG-like jellyroll fold domain-containing protein [Mesonia]|uniref:Uncharacterized protein n=1 Tax=Mesonia oceanica TaxID=2687242 RepID=A0AC61Y813_9FLAO|nr:MULTISPECIES: LamG-like jellyroll fold domain-containing protein [Mesonia]MAN26786.1 hypothetical protein [Mesonia sp.]VVV00328.1 hypothetical protein FVB9532_01597 [Mesonia oceanica]